jgi:hypothetical protein
MLHNLRLLRMELETPLLLFYDILMMVACDF